MDKKPQLHEPILDNSGTQKSDHQENSSRFLINLPEPSFFDKQQKTTNIPFGNAKHFLQFLIKRSKASFDFHQKLKTLELASQQKDFQNIIDLVASSIHAGAEFKLKVCKVRGVAPTADWIGQANSLTQEIKTNSNTLGDFLKMIVKIYTMESFVCYWLNELLRSEDWEGINILNPYLICLTYAFQLQDFIFQNPWMSKVSKMLLKTKIQLTLYRGTLLTEESAHFYMRKSSKYFSWNAITSTSRKRDVALAFLNRPGVSSNGPRKRKVLFVIETETSLLEERIGVIDVAKYSRYPEEEEIILVPGTVFEILSIDMIEDKILQVNLAIIKKFEDKLKDIALLGELEKKVIFEDIGLISGLDQSETLNAFQLIEGNQFIRELRITNMSINFELWAALNKMRKTTNLKEQDINYLSNTLFIENFSFLLEYCSTEQFFDIIFHNKIVFQSNPDKNNSIPPGKLCILQLSKDLIDQFYSQLPAFWAHLQTEKNLQRVDIDKSCNPFYEKIWQSIPAWPNLRQLAITLDGFVSKNTITKSLGNLPFLEKLELDFPSCNGFSNYELNSIGLIIASCHFLCYFSLYVQGYQNKDEKLSGFIRGEALQHFDMTLVGQTTSNQNRIDLKTMITSFSSLRHLSLDFSKNMRTETTKDMFKGIVLLENLRLTMCELSVKDFYNIAESIGAVTSLRDLHIEATQKSAMSDDGWNCFCLSVSQSLNLQNIFLNLEGLIFSELKFSCFMLKGKQRGQKEENSLQYFDLALDGKKTSNQETIHLETAITSFSSLRHLSLDFRRKNWTEIKDILKESVLLENLRLTMCELSVKDFYNIAESIGAVTSLRDLHIEATQKSAISEDGWNCFCFSLSQNINLQSIFLKFTGHIFIESISCLTRSFLELRGLSIISLDFEWEDYQALISDQEWGHLQLLASMPSVKHFSLALNRNLISTQGIKGLSVALRAFSTLQYLSLHFRECEKISDEAFIIFARALTFNPGLKHLSLTFADSIKLSDKSFLPLANSLKSLSFLHFLHLDFHGTRVATQGLTNLTQNLPFLNSLKHIQLRFTPGNITQEGLDTFYPLKGLFLYLDCFQIEPKFIGYKTPWHIKLSLFEQDRGDFEELNSRAKAAASKLLI